MVEQALREDLIEAGQRLVAVADEAAVRPAAAAWLYDHGLGEWRYYMATALVDLVGRRTVFSALAEVFVKVSPPEDFSIVDVYLASPRDPAFEVISSIFRVAGAGALIFENCMINDMRFDAVLYRFDREILREGADELVKAFKTRTRERARKKERARA